MKKLSMLAFGFLVFTAAIHSQILNPVSWEFKAEKVSDQEFVLVYKVFVKEGWVIYSQYIDPQGGPYPTEFVYDDPDYIELIGVNEEIGNVKEDYDNVFEMDLRKISGQSEFRQKIKLLKDIGNVSGFLTFMTCDDERCLPPQDVNFDFKLYE